jgi:hypothetical protein
MTVKARLSGTAGVPSPWHAFTRIFQEPGRPPHLLYKRYRKAEGDQRLEGRVREESYDSIVPKKVGNRHRLGPTGGKG